jgi:hypothetical protein
VADYAARLAALRDAEAQANAAVTAAQREFVVTVGVDRAAAVVRVSVAGGCDPSRRRLGSSGSTVGVVGGPRVDPGRGGSAPLTQTDLLT